ncbi:hypothetical protein BP6252_01048 [Coleophoma cylindrospora]|uniref:F-box domain-containing protein n=1 Tax=Coleophoma cylindrospora TaxID=1849047 RepID=A0A3D8SRT0_9HELO|nr:hypothetical protein BP6252_01048 [Coleophoma cylindrospora]
MRSSKKTRPFTKPFISTEWYASYPLDSARLCVETRQDEPPTHMKPEPVWTDEMGKLLKLESILSKEDPDLKLQHVEFVAETVTDLLRTASADLVQNEESQTISMLRNHFTKDINREALFCHSELFCRARNYDERIPSKLLDMNRRQASAKLHCLYGVPIEATGKKNLRRTSKTYPYACSKVYDLRNYTDKTMWGPFMEDGSGKVDWERMEAIMVTLGFNMRRFDDGPANPLSSYGIWEVPFKGAVPGSYVSRKLPYTTPLYEQPKLSLDAQDPYNVSGTYLRVVCFLDYNDLFNYNFLSEQPGSGPRPPYEATEVIRMIIMEIRVVGIEEPGPDDLPGYPVVYFKGLSRSRGISWDPNANSNIRGKGCVRMTREGEVRWTTFSIYGGEERWRSEGIQIGGIKSGRGVVGNWFDKDYDARGPAGPTAFWKISDEIEDDDSDDEFGEEIHIWI